MRSPHFSDTMRRPPDGKNFENEYLQYLAPESFTVLPPDGNAPAPNPPKAPEPYKLTPRKRHKNQAFAIIAEPTLSVPGSQASSRAGSPTGRVSPFRGRGFNPAGSRHASPAPSPPPGSHPLDREITSLEQLNKLGGKLRSTTITKLSSNSTGRLSQIPVLKSALKSRRSSAEDILSPDTSPTNGGNFGGRNNYDKRQRLPSNNLQINNRYSQSMTNISPRNLIAKPPPSPRRGTLKPSFVRLSPIIGSSPEAGSDVLQSSPSKIPRSRSQPPSRLVSPSNSRTISRGPSRNPSRPVSRAASRPVSRNPSRSASRETSPSGMNGSPTKSQMKTSVYRNIPAKVDSFNRSAANKPKVPTKPKVYSTRNGNLDRSRPSSIRKNTTTTNKYGIKPGTKSGAKRNSNRDTTEDTETTDTERERELVRRDTRTSINSYTSHHRVNTRGGNRSNNRFVDNEKPSTSKSSYSSNEKSSSGQNSKSQLNRSDSRSTVYNGSTKHNSQTYKRNENGAKETTRNSTRRNETATETTTEELSKTEDDEMTEDARDDEILSVTIENILENSTQKIVATTTETVVKPLNIEAKLINKSEAISPSETSNNNMNSGNMKNDNSATNGGNSPPVNNSNTPSNNLNAPSNNSVSSTPKVPSSNNNLTAEQSPQVNNSNTVESVNNNVKQLTSSLTPSINSLDSVKNNLNNLTPPDSDKVNKNLMDPATLTTTNTTTTTHSANEKLKQARTVIVDEIKPIKITVREKSGDVEVQSGNYALPRSATNGIAERPLVPPNNHPPNSAEPPPSEEPKKSAVSKLFSCFKKNKGNGSTVSGEQNMGGDAASIKEVEEGKSTKCWDKMCCKKGSKVGDSSKFSCLPLKKNKEENWAERRDSILSEPPKNVPFSQKLKRILCCKCGKKEDTEAMRRASMMSKKKSMSSTMQPPIEDTGPKLDASLVEHASHMRGAIPVLPVPLAWTCLIFNIFIPGFGTILSGLICLCIGKPRFSPRDSAKGRVGAFLIDIIVGISQCFTVLFCLVGWGWSIWWGVIMLKVARKYRKIKAAEKNAIEDIEQAVPSVNINHTNQQGERGRT